MISVYLKRGLLIGICVALLTACFASSGIKPIEDVTTLSAGDVILVGKIFLDPELKEGEQRVGSMYPEYTNAAILQIDDKPRNSDYLGITDMRDSLTARIGETFFVRGDVESFYIIKAWIPMNTNFFVATPGRPEPDYNAPLHGLFYIDVKPTDKAIYIGTLKYTRDEFFGIVNVQVLDEYESANHEFVKKFGANVSLRKSLAVLKNNTTIKTRTDQIVEKPGVRY